MQGARYLGAPSLSSVQYESLRPLDGIYYPETRAWLAASGTRPVARYWGRDVPDVTDLTYQWGKGSGKDLVCQLAVLRAGYLLCCLASPQGYYGFPAGSPIHLLNVAESAAQASGVFFSPVTRFARRRGLSDNGTVIGVKEPRGVALTPMAVPMSLAAGRGDACNGLIAVGDVVVIAALRCGLCRWSS